jgi:hypothetical protein
VGGIFAPAARLGQALRTGEGQNSPGSGNGLTSPLASALDSRLTAFQNALASFVWPSKTDAWFQSRLTVQNPGTGSQFTANIPQLDSVSNPNKFYSKGENLSAPSGIAAGDYCFALSMGSARETVGVSVGADDTWGDVLGNVRAAINTAPLPVQADVISQNAPFSVEPDLAATGGVLALSVNPDQPAQTVNLADTSGNLLAALGLAATTNPIAPATLGNYFVQGKQLAEASSVSSTPFDANAPTSLALGRHDFAVNLSTNGVSDGPPTTYVSQAHDPNAATTLAPGDYRFSYRFGAENKTLTVGVKSGWTWNDVLQAVAAGINGQAVWTSASGGLPSGQSSFSQPGLVASVQSSPIPSATTAGVFTNGEVLQIGTTAPFASQNFTLSDGSGGLLGSLGLTTKLTGQPLSVTVQSGWTWRDVMSSMANTISSSVPGVAAQTADQNFFSGAVPGQTIVNTQGVGLNVRLGDPGIGQRMTLSDGASGLLAALHMLGGSPAQDGEIVVDGQTQVSGNNAYALDQGRLQLNLESSFANTLPLSVVRSMDSITNGFSDIVNSYNDLQAFINKNAGSWSSALGQTLAAPITNQSNNLAWMGVNGSSKTKQIWTLGQPFFNALVTDPQRAGATLSGEPGGLIPAWQQAVSTIRQTGLESYLATSSGLGLPPDTVQSELDLEQKHRLVNLLG